MSIYKTKQIDGYELIPQINSKTIKNLFDAKIFYWMSYSAFKLAKAIRPKSQDMSIAVDQAQLLNN